MRRHARAACVLMLSVIGPGSASAEPPAVRPAMMTGLNLAGAEFGAPGGVYDKDYRYPSQAEYADVAKRGFTIVRLPFLWERLQPTLMGEFDYDERARLLQAVARAKNAKLAIILDLHNYARYRDMVVGSDKVPVAALADVWRRLALMFQGQDGVVFGLMNEPHDMATQTWAQAAQAALDAIRAAGACNRVLVPGNGWTGAHSWTSDSYGMPNAIALADIRDPAGAMSFEFHQYLDADWSGRAKTCRPPQDVVAALRVATDWLAQRKATGFLAEIGASGDAQCRAGLDAMLAHVADNAAVWRGWTAWAAGAWWPADYPLLLRGDAPALATFAAWRAPADPAFVSAACRKAE